MGYDGILITDAMNMAGISENFGQVEASIRAIQAGIDILLMPCVLYNLENVKDLDAIIEGIEKAVESGDITEEAEVIQPDPAEDAPQGTDNDTEEAAA